MPKALAGIALISAAISCRTPALAETPPGEMAWIKPPALKAGDTIAFAIPAGPAARPPLAEYGRRLEQAGYRVRIPKDVESRNEGYLAGPDELRAEELNAMIRDPKVRAIFPARGGYGLTRILDRIDYEALRKDPKVITGYSDITALHLAIARKARIVTFHSPMPISDLWREDKPEFAFAADSFRRAIFADGYEAGGRGYAIATPPGHKPEKLVGGTARGRLLGGNLTLICSTLGTPFAIEPEGAILFIEDVNEAPYRIDRSLSQLRLAGVLDAVAGVVVGDFGSKDPTAAKEIGRVLRDYLEPLKVPTIRNFPAGHIGGNATLPHGALVELDADRATLKIAEDPVRAD